MLHRIEISRVYLRKMRLAWDENVYIRQEIIFFDRNIQDVSFDFHIRVFVMGMSNDITA